MNNANLTNFKNATIDNLIAKYANITDLRITSGDTLVAEFVNGDCRINNNLLIYGDLIVNGEHYDIDTAHLRISDNLFKIAAENTTNHIDIGYYAPFSNKFIGWIHDKDTSRWKPFKDVANDSTMTLTVPRPLVLGDIEAGNMYATEFYAGGSPISSQISGLNTALSNHVSNTSNPHSVTRGQLGLGVADAVTFDDLRTNSIKSSDVLNIKKASDSKTLLSLDQSGNLDVLGTVEGRNMVTDGSNLDTLVSRVNQAVKTDSSPTFQKIVINEGLELYNALSKPFIDFHEAKDSTGDSSADYKYRIQSEGDSLKVFRIDGLKLGIGQNTSAFFTKLGVGLSPTYSLDIKTESTNSGIRMQGSAVDLKMIFHNESAPDTARVMAINNYSSKSGLIFQALNNDLSHARDVMFVGHGGNVGIGTLDPVHKLFLNESSAVKTTTLHIAHELKAQQVGVDFGKPEAYWSMNIPSNSSNLRFYNNTSGDLLTMSPIGWIGISQGTPSHPLHITNTGSASYFIYLNQTGGSDKIAGMAFRHNSTAGLAHLYQNATGDYKIENNGGSIEYNALNSGLHIFKGNNTERVRITNSGDMGIGITPTEKLHVSGNIKCTGELQGGSLNVGTGAITSGAITGSSLNVGTGAIYCGDIEATQDITAKQYLESTHTTTPSVFLNNTSAVGGGLSGMRQYWDYATSKMRIDGVNYLNTALYTDLLTLDYLGKLTCKAAVLSDLTANKYLKTDGDKKIIAADIETDVRAQFSAGSGIGISSGVISTLNGSYYTTVDNIVFDVGTGSIDSYLHFYTKNSTFCDVSGQIEVFPNDGASHQVTFEVTLPVNHNAVLSQTNIIAQGGATSYAWYIVKRAEIILISGVYNKFKITLHYDQLYGDGLINLRYSYKV